AVDSGPPPERPAGAAGSAVPALFQRAGSILALGPVMSFSGERTLDTLELVVCPDARGHATGTLYEDAGDGFGYRRGEFRVTRWEATTRGDTLRITDTRTEGDWPLPERRVYRVRALGKHAPRVIVLGA